MTVSTHLTILYPDFEFFGGGSQMCAFRMEICNTPQNIIMLESVFVEWELKFFFFPIDDQSKSFRHLQYVRSWDYICTKGYVTFWWKHLDFIESTTPILLSLTACKKKLTMEIDYIKAKGVAGSFKNICMIIVCEIFVIFAWFSDDFKKKRDKH